MLGLGKKQSKESSDRKCENCHAKKKLPCAPGLESDGPADTTRGTGPGTRRRWRRMWRGQRERGGREGRGGRRSLLAEACQEPSTAIRREGGWSGTQEGAGANQQHPRNPKPEILNPKPETSRRQSHVHLPLISHSHPAFTWNRRHLRHAILSISHLPIWCCATVCWSHLVRNRDSRMYDSE